MAVPARIKDAQRPTQRQMIQVLYCQHLPTIRSNGAG